MAENKKSIIVYVESINIFDELSDEEAGKLIKHLFRYVNDLNPDAPDRLTKLLFEPIKQALKRDLVKYENKREKNRNNARIRWDKKDANASERIKIDANHADNDNDNDNDIKEEVIRRNEKPKPNPNPNPDPDLKMLKSLDIDEKFLSTFLMFLKYKRRRGESYKDKDSTLLAYKKLLKLSDNNPVKALEVVENTMANNYAGLFKVENNNKNGSIVTVVPEFLTGSKR